MFQQTIYIEIFSNEHHILETIYVYLYTLGISYEKQLYITINIENDLKTR